MKLESEGPITVAGNVKASDEYADMGGIIELIARESASVEITNSGLLKAAMDMSGTGPGGRVMIAVEQGSTMIDGNIQAQGGMIDISSQASPGSEGEASIDILENTVMNADMVKIAALHEEGVLQIRAGANLSGDSQIQLFAGSSPGGLIRFTGEGNVILSTPHAIMQAHGIEVNPDTAVQVGRGNSTDLVEVIANIRNFNVTVDDVLIHGPININGFSIPNTVTGGIINEEGVGRYRVNNLPPALDN